MIRVYHTMMSMECNILVVFSRLIGPLSGITENNIVEKDMTTVDPSRLVIISPPKKHGASINRKPFLPRTVSFVTNKC